MRVPMVSIFLTGGVLALGACAPIDSSPMTLAERTEQCQRLGTGLDPTGRETGDARQDYRCRNILATTYAPHGRRDGAGSAEVSKVISRGG